MILGPAASLRPSMALSRGELLRRSATACATVLLPPPAGAIDDGDFELNEDDEIPDVRTGRPDAKASKAPKEVTAEDGKAAFARIVAARSTLDETRKLISADDFTGARAQVKSLANLEDSLLLLVNSPCIGLDGKKTIGTIKRYGVGADVLIMMGALDASLGGGSSNKADASDNARKASEALDEVIVVGKSSGLKP